MRVINKRSLLKFTVLYFVRFFCKYLSYSHFVNGKVNINSDKIDFVNINSDKIDFDHINKTSFIKL